MFDSLSKNPQKGFINLSETIQSDNLDSFGVFNFGSRARKSAQKYAISKKRSDLDEETKINDEDSGVCTPPLWRRSPETSPPLSPRSKTQAIARGRRELMEMVQDMPESCYELSLKDMVVRPAPAPAPASENNGVLSRNGVRRKDLNSVKRLENRGFDNGGVILKMGFPINFGLKKKNGGISGRNSFSRVSMKSEDEECWKKRNSMSIESESGSSKSSGVSSGVSSSGSSRSNSGSSSRDGNDVQPGCWSFILTKNSKTTK